MIRFDLLGVFVCAWIDSRFGGPGSVRYGGIPKVTGSVEFQAMVESAEGPVLVVDADGAVTSCNDEVARLFGYAVEEFASLRLSDLIPEPLREVHAVHVDRYHAQPRVRSIESGIVLVGRHRDGTEVPVDISLGPLMLEERPYLMVIVGPHLDGPE